MANQDVPPTKQTEKRYRCFNCVTYLPTALIEQFILEHKVVHYAYITHDRDKKDELSDELKVQHIHLLLYFDTTVPLTTVRNYFHKAPFDIQNTRVEVCESKLASFRYLTHTDNPEKAQYNAECIVSDNSAWWVERDEHGNDHKQDKSYEILESLLQPTVIRLPLRMLAKKYGRDFILNYGKYKQLVQDISYEEEIIRRQAYEQSCDLIAEQIAETHRYTDFGTGEIIEDLKE